VPAAGNSLRHVQAAAAAGCATHLLLTGLSASLSGQPTVAIPGLPPGTQVHADLSAFADWLLAQVPPASKLSA
jgi:D-glycero-D-manno-heptose 1,7-bisphosphate phosphatase